MLIPFWVLNGELQTKPDSATCVIACLYLRASKGIQKELEYK